MFPKQEYPENYPCESIKNIPIPTRYTNIKIPKKDHGKMIFCTSMMGITNLVPSIFQTFSSLLLKSTNLNFRITHSSKTKSRQAKINNYKGTNFVCIFDKNDANENKVKKVAKQ
jgi:hypothetical protein